MSYRRTEIHGVSAARTYGELLVEMSTNLARFVLAGPRPAAPVVRTTAIFGSEEDARAFARWVTTEPRVREAMAYGMAAAALSGDPQEFRCEVRGARVSFVLTDVKTAAEVGS